MRQVSVNIVMCCEVGVLVGGSLKVDLVEQRGVHSLVGVVLRNCVQDDAIVGALDQRSRVDFSRWNKGEKVVCKCIATLS